MEDIAVSIQGVSKSFKLPHEKRTSIKSFLINPFRRGTAYEKQEVLKNISLDIKKGEFFGIVGKNGGGKSTLLKVIASIYAPQKGKMFINGKLVPFIELGVGFNPELTGRDNVYLNGAMLGFSNKEIDAIYKDIVAFAELERFMDQKLKNYSSGMQVRLAFSVATHANADILLIDEVLAVGDANFQRKCYDYFSSLKKNKKTVIFISHDMNAVREYCDRVVLIDNGEIVKSGSAEEISEAYSRIFADEGTPRSDSNDKQSKRWGDGAIKLSLENLTLNDESIRYKIQCRAEQDISSFVLGMSIRSEDGRTMIGTNTQYLQKKIPSLKKGETLSVTWQILNALRDGKYALDITCHGYGGQPVHDWWNDAASFSLSSGRNSPYALTPPIKLIIEKK